MLPSSSSMLRLATRPAACASASAPPRAYGGTPGGPTMPGSAASAAGATAEPGYLGYPSNAVGSFFTSWNAVKKPRPIVLKVSRSEVTSTTTALVKKLLLAEADQSRILRIRQLSEHLQVYPARSMLFRAVFRGVHTDGSSAGPPIQEKVTKQPSGLIVASAEHITSVIAKHMIKEMKEEEERRKKRNGSWSWRVYVMRVYVIKLWEKAKKHIREQCMFYFAAVFYAEFSLHIPVLNYLNGLVASYIALCEEKALQAASSVLASIQGILKRVKTEEATSERTREEKENGGGQMRKEAASSVLATQPQQPVSLQSTHSLAPSDRRVSAVPSEQPTRRFRAILDVKEKKENGENEKSGKKNEEKEKEKRKEPSRAAPSSRPKRTLTLLEALDEMQSEEGSRKRPRKDEEEKKEKRSEERWRLGREKSQGGENGRGREGDQSEAGVGREYGRP